MALECHKSFKCVYSRDVYQFVWQIALNQMECHKGSVRMLCVIECGKVEVKVALKHVIIHEISLCMHRGESSLAAWLSSQ